MNLTRDRVRSIGWVFVLGSCAVLTAGLMLRVNAVKGQVHEAEQRIVSLRHEIVFLETEFKTRANQQQLKMLNDVEFGYRAPRAAQYIEGERQLAVLGKPRAPGAPKPIRVANGDSEKQSSPRMAMVSPIAATTPSPEAQSPVRPEVLDVAETPSPAGAQPGGDAVTAAIEAAGLADRLERIELPEARGQ